MRENAAGRNEAVRWVIASNNTKINPGLEIRSHSALMTNEYGNWYRSAAKTEPWTRSMPLNRCWDTEHQYYACEYGVVNKHSRGQVVL